MLWAVCSACVLALLVGCSAQNVEPDPVAPIVLEGTCEPVEIPVPVRRTPPAELQQPMTLESPEILEAGTGDYGITRAGLELIIEGFRRATERIQRWTVWASPNE